MQARQVWIERGDSRLYGELYLPDKTPASAMLICHGLNSQGFHYLKIYRQLAETACRNGFVSLLFDFRGVGKSPGEFDYGLGEQQDLKAALSFLAGRPEVVSDRIFVVGHSLGGAVSLYALRNEPRVKGLVLWSTPKDHDYNVRKFIRRTRGTLSLYLFGFFAFLDKLVDVSRLFRLEVYGLCLRPRYVRGKLMRLNECQAVAQLEGTPLLVVIGSLDAIVGVDEAEAIFQCAHEPKRLVVIDSADHVYRGKEDELVAATMDWILSLSES